jgi:hypothetical protein
VAHPGDYAICGEVPGERVDEQPVLDEAFGRVEKQRQALAHEEFVLLGKLLVVLRSATALGPLDRLVDTGPADVLGHLVPKLGSGRMVPASLTFTSEIRAAPSHERNPLRLLFL